MIFMGGGKDANWTTYIIRTKAGAGALYVSLMMQVCICSLKVLIVWGIDKGLTHVLLSKSRV